MAAGRRPPAGRTVSVVGGAGRIRLPLPHDSEAAVIQNPVILVDLLGADVRRGAWIAIAWTLLAYLGAIVIGLSARALYGRGAVQDPEHILPFMLQKLVPGWLAGLLLVGAVAAIMSTASSLLLIVCSTVTEDLVRKTLRLDPGERTLVLVSRATLLGTGALALGLALAFPRPVFSAVSWVWAGIGCAFSPAAILSFYWKRFSGAGVVASLVAGFATTALWMNTPAGDRVASALFGAGGTVSVMFASFVVAFAAAVTASLLFPGGAADGRAV